MEVYGSILCGEMLKILIEWIDHARELQLVPEGSQRAELYGWCGKIHYIMVFPNAVLGKKQCEPLHQHGSVCAESRVVRASFSNSEG